MAQPIAKTSRSFKAYATVEALRNGSPDIRSALIPFFQPLLAFANGRVLDANALSIAANQEYDWSITSDIVEDLIPAFMDQGWVAEVEASDSGALFRVTCHLPDGAFYSKLTDDLKELSESFLEFINNISPLSSIDRTVDDLLNALLRWLISLDSYSESELKREIVRTSETGPISVHEVYQVPTGVTPDEQYLCARFCANIIKEDSHLIKAIVAAARVGLLIDAVQDFKKPVTSVKQTSCAFYLDAPVAMDYLEVSGQASFKNIKPIIERIIGIGGSIRIFKESVEEIKHNLNALLKRSEPQRTGPTAMALRRGQVMEAYVREIAARPEAALAGLGVQVVERSLEQFPNDHKHFNIDNYRDVYGILNWHLEDRPRAHDAFVVTNIMRMRQGKISSDLFESRHLLITRNGILPAAARRYAIDQKMLDARSIGPVVHQRQLATAVWLRAGLNDNGNEVPLRYLMQSCERVLQLRPDVIGKVRQQAALRSDATAKQLDMLLTLDRSTQVLMDKTLNTSTVVTGENVDELIHHMKQALIAEQLEHHRAEVQEVRRVAASNYRSLKKDAEAKLDAASKDRASHAAKASMAEDQLDRIAGEDQFALDRLADDVNGSLKRVKTQSARLVTYGSLAADVAACLVGYYYPTTTTLILVILISLLFVGSALGWLQAYIGYGVATEEKATAIAWEKAIARGVEAKLQRSEVSYSGEQITIVLKS